MLLCLWFDGLIKAKYSATAVVPCEYMYFCNTVRLVQNGSNATSEGRLEVYYNRTWGTVCDDRFTDVAAKIACNELGFGYVVQHKTCFDAQQLFSGLDDVSDISCG